MKRFTVCTVGWWGVGRDEALLGGEQCMMKRFTVGAVRDETLHGFYCW